MKKAIAFIGPSNSGKTTLIEKIAKRLIGSYKIAIIKNDPSNKAEFDKKGKDSYIFFQTGAEVVVTSPKRTTYFSNRQKSLDEIIEMIKDFDILLIEGLKYLPLPKLGIFRNKVDESYFRYIKAAAVDDSIDKSKIPKGIEILDLNDIDGIINWILNNSKSI